MFFNGIYVPKLALYLFIIVILLCVIVAGKRSNKSSKVNPKKNDMLLYDMEWFLDSLNQIVPKIIASKRKAVDEYSIENDDNDLIPTIQPTTPADDESSSHWIMVIDKSSSYLNLSTSTQSSTGPTTTRSTGKRYKKCKPSKRCKSKTQPTPLPQASALISKTTQFPKIIEDPLLNMAKYNIVIKYRSSTEVPTKHDSKWFFKLYSLSPTLPEPSEDDLPRPTKSDYNYPLKPRAPFKVAEPTPYLITPWSSSEGQERKFVPIEIPDLRVHTYKDPTTTAPTDPTETNLELVQSIVVVNRQSLHSCVACILTPNWILSSGHCFKKRDSPSDHEFFHFEGGVRKASKLVMHPDFYRVGAGDNDIALIRIDTPYEGVKPIEIFNGTRYDMKNCFVTDGRVIVPIYPRMAVDSVPKALSRDQLPQVVTVDSQSAIYWAHRCTTLDGLLLMCAGNRLTGVYYRILNSDPMDWGGTDNFGRDRSLLDCYTSQSVDGFTLVPYHYSWISRVIQSGGRRGRPLDVAASSQLVSRRGGELPSVPRSPNYRPWYSRGWNSSDDSSSSASRKRRKSTDNTVLTMFKSYAPSSKGYMSAILILVMFILVKINS